MKKLFIIVLYKVSVKECITINSFKKCNLFANSNNTFIIWDNSPNPNLIENCNVSSFLGRNVLYESHTENTPLAHLYNNCISRNQNFDVVCIFDQDSEILQDNYDLYIDNIISDNSHIPVFLPQIFKNNKLYSPGKFWVFKGWHYPYLKEGEHNDKLYTAIMSGTIIRISSLKEYDIDFNEELKLYGIDTCFFTDLRKKNSYYYLLQTKLKHNLSEEDLNNEDYKKRTEIYLNCCFQTARGNKFYIFLIKLYKSFLKLLGKI